MPHFPSLVSREVTMMPAMSRMVRLIGTISTDGGTHPGQTLSFKYGDSVEHESLFEN